VAGYESACAVALVKRAGKVGGSESTCTVAVVGGAGNSR
jgi:hypothetical protein